MKKIFFILTLFILNLSNVWASDIYGLNQKQINDFEICLKQKGLSYSEINRWRNSINLGIPTEGSVKLYHNFVHNNNDLNEYGENAFSNAIIASGLFHIEGDHSFDNSIIANATFIGDYSNLSFKNACIVNVQFNDAGFFTILIIRDEASFSKNISTSY